MSAPTEQMLTWLKAMISERLRIAREAAEWHGEGDWYSKDDLTDYDHIDLPLPVALHVVANSPADVIAQCEADLALLGDVLEKIQYADDVIEGEWGSSLGLADMLIRRLAEGYQHRAGYGSWEATEALPDIWVRVTFTVDGTPGEEWLGPFPGSADGSHLVAIEAAIKAWHAERADAADMAVKLTVEGPGEAS